MTTPSTEYATLPDLRTILGYGIHERNGAPQPGRTYAHVAVTNTSRAMREGFQMVGNIRPYRVAGIDTVLMWKGDAIPSGSDDSILVIPLVDESIIEALEPKAAPAPAKKVS